MSMPGGILHRPASAGRKAFTLVELLVVIGIIAVLISILLPSLAKARQAANRVACASNMRQIGQMFMMYLPDNKGRLPLAKNGSWGSSYCAAAEWAHAISPKGDAKYDWPWARSCDDYDNYVAATKTFVCPAQAQDADVQRTYLLIGTVRWHSRPWYGDCINTVFGHLPEGYPLVAAPVRQLGVMSTAETIMMGEATVNGPDFDSYPGDPVPRKWHIGGNISMASFGDFVGDTYGPWAHEQQGANYLFCDGHVEYQASPVRYFRGVTNDYFDRASTGASDGAIAYTKQFMVIKEAKDPKEGTKNHAAWWVAIPQP